MRHQKYTLTLFNKEKDTVKAAQRCILPTEAKEFSWDKKEDQSKALARLEDQNIISYDDAVAILQSKYGGKVIKIVHDEFEVDEWQLVKKIEHSVCFDINFADYGFTNEQAVEINQGKDGLVGYVQRLNTLPCNALISAYQDAIKQFCEDKSVERDDDAIFRGKPAIIFSKENTKYITFVIFNPDTKRYVSSYKMASDSPQALRYKRDKVLGLIE